MKYSSISLLQYPYKTMHVCMCVCTYILAFLHSTSGLSWVNLPEVEPLGPGLYPSTAYSLSGPSTGLSYHHPPEQAILLGQSTTEGAAVLTTPKSSLLSAPTTSPHLVYPPLAAATAGTSFQHAHQLHQQPHGLPSTTFAPPGVIHPRPSPSTSSAPPSGSELPSGGHTQVSMDSNTQPMPTQPTTQPTRRLPLTSKPPAPHHHPSETQPLPPTSSVPVAGAGALSEPLPSAAGLTAPPLASTATLRHPHPPASWHTSVQHSQRSPTVFVSPLTSHSAAAVQQTQSTPLPSAPATLSLTAGHQPSLPLGQHFAVSTPLRHTNAFLDYPPPTSIHIPHKPPVFPIAATSHPLPSPGLSSVRSSAHAVPTAAATAHRGYPYSPLPTSPIPSGSDDSVLTKSSDGGVGLQGKVHSQSRSEHPPPGSSEAVLRHVYGDSSTESSTSHLSSLSSLTPHGIIQSLLAHAHGEEEAEATLQSSTFSPLQSDLSHLEPSGQSDPIISPLAPETVAHTGGTSEAYNLAQQTDSLSPHSLPASKEGQLHGEDSPTQCASVADKPSMTLQEAFLLKKSLFIQRSQERQKQALAKAKQAQWQGGGTKKASTRSVTATQPPEGGQSSELTTSTEDSQPSSTEQCRSAEGQPRSTSSRGKRSVTFSSPVTVLQSSGLFSPPEVHSTKGE